MSECGYDLAIKAGKMRHAHAIRSNVAFIERFVESSSMSSQFIDAVFLIETTCLQVCV